jgi:hypothetical protein
VLLLISLKVATPILFFFLGSPGRARGAQK